MTLGTDITWVTCRDKLSAAAGHHFRSSVLERLICILKLERLLHPIALLVIALPTESGQCVWATHFIAMLAYDGGYPISYDAGLTALSILVAMGMCWAAFTAAFRWQSVSGVIGAGCLFVTKPEASTEIAGQTPLASLQMVEGANHMGMLESAEQYNSAVAAFARSVFL